MQQFWNQSKNLKKKIEKSFQNTITQINNIFDNGIIKQFEQKTYFLAKKYLHSKNVYIIGRQMDLATAHEASLKLKEISYLHCEAYPAGELKHGTISSIDEESLVIAIITQKNICDKTINAVHETKSRGAKILIVTNMKSNIPPDCFDDIIELPTCDELIIPIESIIPLQLFSYHFSTLLGLDPDKPRNLAKSVTVE